VRIRNDGQEPITFELRSSCECTIVDEPLIDLAPGHTHEVDLSLDLTSSGPDKTEAAIRPFQVALTAVPKSGSSQVQQWNVGGLVKSPFQVVPPSLNLGSEILRGQKIEDAAFTVRCFEQISDITTTSDSGALRTSVKRVSPDTFEVGLTFADRFTAAIGKFSTRVQIFARGVNGTRFQPQIVVLSGAVVGPLKVEPDTIQFGLQDVGDQVQGRFVIRSRGDELFRLVRIDAGGLAFEPVERPLDYRRRLEIPFRQRISEPGERQHAVEFLLDLKNTREHLREKALVRYHSVDRTSGE
jgi:hypothetical protein